MTSAESSSWARALSIGVVGGALMFALAWRTNARPPRAASASRAAPVVELRVPRTHAPVKIDGELAEPDWTRGPARTGAFLDGAGAAARPFSEARALWDDGHLYLALYAADEDIRVAKVAPDGPVWNGDAFRMLFTRADGSLRSIDVGASGIVTDASGAPRSGIADRDVRWQSGAVVATDMDGTPDDPADFDEEWVVEMAIPLAALGLAARPGERIGFAIQRCDVVAGTHACSSWGRDTTRGAIVFE